MIKKNMRKEAINYDENEELLIKAKNGDEDAMSRLIELNLPLVSALCKKFLNRGYDYEDIFQIGCIGLVKAVNNFDPSFKVKFSTYAVPMIMGEVKRFLRDDGIIKVSRSIKENYCKIMAFLEEKRKNEDKAA